MAGALDDDVALETKVIAQGEQGFLRRIGRRVLPLGRVRKYRTGTEYVAVRVDGARRRRKSRSARRRMGPEPSGIGGEHRRDLAVHRPLALSRASRRGYTRRAFPSKIRCLSAAG